MKLKPETETKYIYIKYSLILLFGVVFLFGLFSRTFDSSARGRDQDPNSRNGEWKIARVDDITTNFTQNIQLRRDIMDQIRNEPNNPILHNEMGVALAKDGLFSEAITCFLKTVELDPENATAYHNLGVIHEYLEAYDEAREYLRMAESIDPENKSISSTLNRVEFVLEYKPSGREKYESQLNKALIAMGKQNTNLDYASEILHQLVVDNPSRIEALNALGVVKARKGEVDSAEEIFFKVISEEPGYIYAYINLATIYEANNDFEQSIDYLEKAMNLADDRGTKREIEQRMKKTSMKSL